MGVFADLTMPSSVYRSISIINTGAVIKAAPGHVYGFLFSNNSGSAIAYVKLYDKATTPTGSDTPIATILIPIGGTVSLGMPQGMPFAAGISIRATTVLADADNTSPGAGVVIGQVFYQ